MTETPLRLSRGERIRLGKLTDWFGKAVGAVKGLPDTLRGIPSLINPYKPHAPTVTSVAPGAHKRRISEISGEEFNNRIQQGGVFDLYTKDQGGPNPYGQYQPIFSTAVAQMKWEPKDKRNKIGSVWLQFTSSQKKYEYPNVPFPVVQAFMSSASKGQYVNYILKPRYSTSVGRLPRSWRRNVRFQRTGAKARLMIHSNNTADLSFQSAMHRMRSSNQAAYHQMADHLYSALNVQNYKLHDVIGDWSDGAENSLLHRIDDHMTPETARYVAAWFGLLANQKAVLHFGEDDKGHDSLYELDVPDPSLEKVRETLDKHGLHARTLMPMHGQTKVLIYDKGRKLRPNVEQFTKDTNATAKESAGVGELVGASGSSPTRTDARSIYRSIIDKHENAHGIARSYNGNTADAKSGKTVPLARSSAIDIRVRCAASEFLPESQIPVVYPEEQSAKPASRRERVLAAAKRLREQDKAGVRDVIPVTPRRSVKPLKAPDLSSGRKSRKVVDPRDTMKMPDEPIAELARRSSRASMLAEPMKCAMRDAESGPSSLPQPVDPASVQGVTPAQLKPKSFYYNKRQDYTPTAPAPHAKAPAQGLVVRGQFFKGGQTIPTKFLPKKPA